MVLSRIELFPIKSLDGTPVTTVRISDGGILEQDRVYAMAGIPRAALSLRPASKRLSWSCAKKHLPSWASSERFNHFYRFAVNTSVPLSEAGKILRVGDTVDRE